MGFNFNVSFGNQPQSVTIDREGNYFYEIWSSENNSNSLTTDKQKLNAVLSNIPLLKVFAFNADLFSSGKVINNKGEEFLPKQMPKPNPKQTWSQYFWEYMFWLQFGTVYQYNDKASNTTQFLNPAKISFDSSLVDKMKGIILRNVTFKDILNGSLKYDLGNGRSQMIPLKDVVPYFDLSSGMNDNFYKGASRLDALWKVVGNFEETLDSKSTNLKHSKKFILTGQKKDGVQGLESLPMGQAEKDSIERAVNGNKQIHATKQPMSLIRMVEDMAKLKLDDSLKDDFLLIASMYGVPKELIDIISEGSTFENQEKAMARHIDYFHASKAKVLIEGLQNVFGWTDLEYSFSHLSFNQIFEKEREEKEKTKQERIKLYLENVEKAKALNINIEDL
ncbi:hypothetical protein BWK60_01985 [Flavobacterium covae]|uniref:phage portal protein n=1 Tax=Flavobacterium covae TaxID=2906076 RepID=UPI000B4D9194|nr:phage portal protein [Flavobacterium covae]OWP87783.1 hypothetical protein BWK60_01985 [Flavobacterium covae]